MQIESTGNAVVDEAIELLELFSTKSNIYGEFANCKMMIVPGENPGTSFVVASIEDTIMFNIPLKNDAYQIYGAGSGVHKLGLNVYDQNIVNELYPKFLYYDHFSSTNLPLAQDDELRNNAEFENLLGLKASQGLKYFHLPDLNNPGEVYLIPMFAGFLNLNKNDRVGAKIYALDQFNHLIKFNIFKKKINRNVEMYCRVLKL